jgi:hypothetical protein
MFCLFLVYLIFLFMSTFDKCKSIKGSFVQTIHKAISLAAFWNVPIRMFLETYLPLQIIAMAEIMSHIQSNEKRNLRTRSAWAILSLVLVCLYLMLTIIMLIITPCITCFKKNKFTERNSELHSGMKASK